MGDDLLDLPVLRARRLCRGARRCRAEKCGARALGQPRTTAGAAPSASSSSWCCARRGQWDALVARRIWTDVHAGLLALRRRSRSRCSPASPRGKAWERYKLIEGRWIDRRRVRQSPHFILGLNYLVAGQVDLAIEELEKARRLDPGALELRLVLGNLYREKGQVGRAIQEHQALLQRPRLNRSSTPTCCCASGLDYRRGGFVDRAVAAFSEVLKLDRNNEAALVNLEKLQEDQHQWQEAYVTRQRLAQIAGPPDQPKSQSILAFLENELGLQALKEGRLDEAARRFEAAIELDRTVIPAYLHLGDVRTQQGDLPGRGRDLGAGDRRRARPRLPGARPAGARVRRARRATSGSPSCAAG